MSLTDLQTGESYESTIDALKQLNCLEINWMEFLNRRKNRTPGFRGRSEENQLMNEMVMLFNQMLRLRHDIDRFL